MHCAGMHALCMPYANMFARTRFTRERQLGRKATTPSVTQVIHFAEPEILCFLLILFPVCAEEERWWWDKRGLSLVRMQRPGGWEGMTRRASVGYSSGRRENCEGIVTILHRYTFEACQRTTQERATGWFGCE
jgi:hypothetical protein